VIAAARRSRNQSGAQPHPARSVTNRISNICAAIIAIWAFAAIAIESGAHHQPTHSGTQPEIRYDHN